MGGLVNEPPRSTVVPWETDAVDPLALLKVNWQPPESRSTAEVVVGAVGALVQR